MRPRSLERYGCGAHRSATATPNERMQHWLFCHERSCRTTAAVYLETIAALLRSEYPYIPGAWFFSTSPRTLRRREAAARGRTETP